VKRWSARKWFARILISWGLRSAATAFVETPLQFNVVRFLLGLAEAGFFPGIIVYFTHWFALGFWLPTTVRSLSGGCDRSALLFSGLFYLCGVAGVLYAGLFLAASAIPGQPFWLVMIWLCFTRLVVYSWPPPFWALTTQTLSASAAAAGIGLVNMFGNLAGYVGNHFFGWLKGKGPPIEPPIARAFFLAFCYLLGGLIVSQVRVQKQEPIGSPCRAIQWPLYALFSFRPLS